MVTAGPSVPRFVLDTRTPPSCALKVTCMNDVPRALQTFVEGKETVLEPGPACNKLGNWTAPLARRSFARLVARCVPVLVQHPFKKHIE